MQFIALYVVGKPKQLPDAVKRPHAIRRLTKEKKYVCEDYHDPTLAVPSG